MTALPPLVDDLAAWVGQPIEAAADVARAEAVLSAASNLAAAYAGKVTEWATDVPADVHDIVVRVAARVWLNPGGLQSVTIDDATRRWFDSAAAGLYLSDEEKVALDRFRTTSSGLGVISTTREDPRTGTIYVPTGPPPAGYDFPWYAADGY